MFAAVFEFFQELTMAVIAVLAGMALIAVLLGSSLEPTQRQAYASDLAQAQSAGQVVQALLTPYN